MRKSKSLVIITQILKICFIMRFTSRIRLALMIGEPNVLGAKRIENVKNGEVYGVRSMSLKRTIQLVENNRLLKLLILLLAANNFEPVEGETKLKLLVSLVDKMLGGRCEK